MFISVTIRVIHMSLLMDFTPISNSFLFPCYGPCIHVSVREGSPPIGYQVYRMPRPLVLATHPKEGAPRTSITPLFLIRAVVFDCIRFSFIQLYLHMSFWKPRSMATYSYLQANKSLHNNRVNAILFFDYRCSLFYSDTSSHTKP